MAEGEDGVYSGRMAEMPGSAEEVYEKVGGVGALGAGDKIKMSERE